LEAGGTVDGGWAGATGGEEGGVVGAFFGGVEVGAFGMGAQEGGGVGYFARAERREDLVRWLISILVLSYKILDKLCCFVDVFPSTQKC
jgi:hypothetical protein